MPITFIGLVAILVLLRSFKASTKFVLFCFVLGALLQASAAIVLGSNGITPAHFLILTLIVLCFRKGNVAAKFAEIVRFPSGGFFLLLLAVYCLFAAIFLPRLFAGATDINPVGGGEIETSGLPVFYALMPSQGNITQPIYVVGSIMVFFLVIAVIESREEYDLLLKAFVTFAVANVLFGIIDILTYYTHTDFLLGFIRNGNYIMRTDETGFLGLKRIAGSYTETSTYSAVTLVLFAFTMRLWLGAFNNRYLLLLSLVEFVFLALSTSSTAMAGMLVMGNVLWITSVARLATRRVPASVYSFVVFLPLTVGTIVLAIMINPTLQETIMEILNASLLNKASSASGIERLALNAQAFVNFSDTWGLGVGVGSARTSSIPLAVMSNVGVPGCVLLATFLAYVFLSGSPFPPESEEETFQQAARMACLAGLVSGTISGTSMDLGLTFYMFAAASYLPHFKFWKQRLDQAAPEPPAAEEAAPLFGHAR
jgi:hypothetical protein